MSGPSPSPDHQSDSGFRAAPEAQWKFRRIHVYALTLLLVAALFTTILLAPSEDLQRIAGWLIELIGFVTVLYLVAPSAQDLLAMLAQLRFPFRAPPPPPPPSHTGEPEA
jgi:hypothetical protein